MSRKTILLIGAFLILALLVAACSNSGQPTAAPVPSAKNADGYTDISAEQLAEMMPDKDFTLVNVHIPFAGDIPQTDVSIPYDTITQHLDQLPGKGDPIVLYCRSGNMSTQAAKALAELGYTNVMELDGGFDAWKAAGNVLLGQ
ncbi:MAG: rhodanese-like domain-containing protein [Caldilineales bacterium]|nr:rhodanese-like domain-containing protein [Caldilineales bacterium]